MKKWNLSRLQTTSLQIGASLLFCTLMVMADQVPSVPTGLKAKVDDGLQATELVIRRNCLAGAELSQDFAMHVPLKENGEPNFKKQYYTGSIKILPKATATSKSCLEYNVLRRGK